MRKTVLGGLVGILILARTAGAGDLRLDFEPIVGFGGTFGGTLGDATFNLNAGATFFTVDQERHTGFLGVGVVLDLYDFEGHPGEIRDPADHTSGFDFGGGSLTTVFVTFVPIRLGPFTYQVSLSEHVKSWGLDRGRVHLLTLDVLEVVRLVKDE